MQGCDGIHGCPCRPLKNFDKYFAQVVDMSEFVFVSSIFVIKAREELQGSKRYPQPRSQKSLIKEKKRRKGARRPVMVSKNQLQLTFIL